MQRSLKMNDYTLSHQLLKHFPTLRGQEAAVQIAEQFKELRQLLVNRKTKEQLGDEKLAEERFNQQLEASLLVALQTIPKSATMTSTMSSMAPDLLSSL